jgi:hypothetical protein
MSDDYWSERYGDLEGIASTTRGRCHLCHENVVLALYGRTGLFGGDTVTVDHLEPQVFGGDDDADNLRIAHGNCNSLRGVKDPEAIRLALAGTTDEPLSDTAFNLLSVGGSVAVGVAAGHAFASTNQRGEREFNQAAAWVAGLLTFAFTRELY